MRKAGLGALLGAAMAVLGNTVVLLTDPAVSSDRVSYPLSTGAFDLGQVWFAASQALMAFGILGLARSGVAGRGRAASAFGMVAVVGMALKIPGELGLMMVASQPSDSSAASAASTPFGLGVLLADIGLIGFGVLVLRRGTWPAPWRILPASLGLFELLVATPVSLSLGFASPASYVAIVIADLLMAALGIALIRFGATTTNATSSPRHHRPQERQSERPGRDASLTSDWNARRSAWARDPHHKASAHAAERLPTGPRRT